MEKASQPALLPYSFVLYASEPMNKIRLLLAVAFLGLGMGVCSMKDRPGMNEGYVLAVVLVCMVLAAACWEWARRK